MNLFSRISEVLDDGDEPVFASTSCCSDRVDHLVRVMKANLDRSRRYAVHVITAERAVARELNRQIHSRKQSEILVNRLQEEHTRALHIKSAVKRDLRQMHEGMEQAVQFRDTLLQWRNIEEGKKLATWRRLFWRAYHRICDLTDERLDQFDRSAPVEAH